MIGKKYDVVFAESLSLPESLVGDGEDMGREGAQALA